MILRILTWESRTTPRLYFQRAVLDRTALCFCPKLTLIAATPKKPQARLKPFLLFPPLPRFSSSPPASVAFGFMHRFAP